MNTDESASDNLTARELINILSVFPDSLPIIKTDYSLNMGELFAMETIGELKAMLFAMPGNREVESGFNILRLNKNSKLAGIMITQPDALYFDPNRLPVSLQPDATLIMIRGREIYAGELRFDTAPLTSDDKRYVSDWTAAKFQMMARHAPSGKVRDALYDRIKRVMPVRQANAA